MQAAAAETDPGSAGSLGHPGEELGWLQTPMAAFQGPEHWDATAGQGLPGWAHPFLAPHAHEVTQPSAWGEAIGSKLMA